MTLLQPGTVIPPGAHLLGNGATVIDPDVLLRAVRETATIVRPGETLIIRLPMAMPDPVFAQYAQGVMQGLEKAGVRAVVLRADQLAVAEPETDDAFAERVAAVVERIDLRADSAGYGFIGHRRWRRSATVSGSSGRPEPDHATIDRAPYEPGPS